MEVTDPSDRLLVNKKELAVKVLKCAQPTLDRIIERYPDFPVEQRGSSGVEYLYDAGRVAEFLQQKREEEARASEQRSMLFDQFSLPMDEIAPEQAKGLTPAQRMAVARARLLEQRLAVESGFLVSVSELRVALTSMFSRLGRAFDAIPGQIAHRHNLPEPVARSMRAQIDDLRRNLVREISELLKDGAAVGATVQSDAAAEDFRSRTDPGSLSAALPNGSERGAGL